MFLYFLFLKNCFKELAKYNMLLKRDPAAAKALLLAHMGGTPKQGRARVRCRSADKLFQALKLSRTVSKKTAKVDKTKFLTQWDFCERMSWSGFDEEEQQELWRLATKAKYGPWVPAWFEGELCVTKGPSKAIAVEKAVTTMKQGKLKQGHSAPSHREVACNVLGLEDVTGSDGEDIFEQDDGVEQGEAPGEAGFEDDDPAAEVEGDATVEPVRSAIPLVAVKEEQPSLPRRKLPGTFGESPTPGSDGKKGIKALPSTMTVEESMAVLEALPEVVTTPKDYWACITHSETVAQHHLDDFKVSFFFFKIIFKNIYIFHHNYFFKTNFSQNIFGDHQDNASQLLRLAKRRYVS